MTCRMVIISVHLLFSLVIERSADLRPYSIVMVALWRKEKEKKERKNIC